MANRQKPGVKTNQVRGDETKAEGSNNEVLAGSTSDGDEQTPLPSVASVETEVENSTPVLTGLNRLKQRPRIQIQSAASHPNKSSPASTISAVPAVSGTRKINPLIARRKLGVATSTPGTTLGAVD